MDTKQEHGLNCEVVAATDFVDKSVVVRGLVNKYLVAVKDKYSADEIMNIMTIAIEKPTFFLFLVEKEGDGVGIMTAHSVDGGKNGMIHIGFIDDKLVTKKEAKYIVMKGMALVYEWAKSNNMQSIFAQTQRSEKPFDKLLFEHGWKRLTTVYEKEISDGKSEKD